VSFDGLIEELGDKYPFTHLKPYAAIVNNPDFENGIAKLQGGAEGTLTIEEKEAVAIFLIVDEEEEDNDVVQAAGVPRLGFAERLLRTAESNKRRRVGKSKYRCTRHVIATSNICERLFSRAKLLMSHLRRSMSPATLNMLLFLKANRDLWGHPSIMQEIMDELAAARAAGATSDDDEEESEDEEDL
jgi:hypothetical protein